MLADAPTLHHPSPRAPQPDAAARAAAVSAALSALGDLPARLALIRARVAGRLVFTTSFGIEDQAIGHAIFSQDLAIEVATLDTGRLFPETYDVWARTERRYGRAIRAFSPDRAAVEALVARQGIDGFRNSVEARKACCAVRKVDGLGRALAGASGWITGVRAGQSAGRARMAFAEADAPRGLVKLNPLLDWSRDRVAAFVRDHGVPANVLHARGFLSIGCAPCTRAVGPDEPERAGRWWWEADDKKECGLHHRPPGPPGPSGPSGPSAPVVPAREPIG